MPAALTLVLAGASAAPAPAKNSVLQAAGEISAANSPENANLVQKIFSAGYTEACFSAWHMFDSNRCWCYTGCGLDCSQGGTPGTPGLEANPQWCTAEDLFLTKEQCKELTCELQANCEGQGKAVDSHDPGLTLTASTAGYTCPTLPPKPLPPKHLGGVIVAWMGDDSLVLHMPSNSSLPNPSNDCPADSCGKQPKNDPCFTPTYLPDFELTFDGVAFGTKADFVAKPGVPWHEQQPFVWKTFDRCPDGEDSCKTGDWYETWLGKAFRSAHPEIPLGVPMAGNSSHTMSLMATKPPGGGPPGGGPPVDPPCPADDLADKGDGPKMNWLPDDLASRFNFHFK